MSADIPRSVMEEAREIARLHGGYEHGTLGYLDLAETIADALLARDKRAAEIAERLRISPRYGEWPYPTACADIRDAILRYPEGKEDGL